MMSATYSLIPSRKLATFSRLSALFILLCLRAAGGYGQGYVNNASSGTSGGATYPFNQIVYSSTGSDYKVELDYAAKDFTKSPVAGYIKKVYFRFTSVNNPTSVTNLQISMAQTAAALSGGTYYTTGLKQVYYAPTTTIAASAGVWYPITLTTPYLYDPAKTLIVQVTHTGLTGGNNMSYVSNTSLTRHRIYSALATDVTGTADQNMYDFGMDISPSAANNAGITALVSPAYFCAGSYGIQVKAANLGSNALTSVNLNWSFDGVSQTAVSWPYTIPAGRDTIITLGTKSFSAGTVHTLKVWTSSPNATTDADATDDTLYNNNISPALSGSYTINPSGSGSTNFTSFSAAAAALNAYGVCGPVRVSISPGTYSETVSFDNIQGTSAANNIILDGLDSNKVTITYTGSTAIPHTIRINGTNYMTLKRMTILNTGTANAFNVQITGGGSYNTITSCISRQSTTATSTTMMNIGIAGATYSSCGNNGNYNIINNNLIDGGCVGVMITGTSATVFCTGNQVTNNTFTNTYSQSIDFWYNTNCIATNNKCTLRPITTGTAQGIYVYNSGTCTVTGNYISGPAQVGIILNGVSGGGLAANNMIVSNYFSTAYGLYCTASPNSSVYHNSIYFTAPGGYAMYILSATDVRDNIVYKTSANAYCLYSTSSSYFTKLDYNDFYSLGGTYCYIAAAYADLPALQKGYPAFNQNSLSTDPGYASIVTNSENLHIGTASTGVYGTYVGINTDIDGDNRCQQAPNMGADETMNGKTKPYVKFFITSNIYPGSPSYVYQTAKAGEPKVHHWYLQNSTYGTLTKISDSVVLFTNKFTVGSNTLKLVTLSCGGNDSFQQTFTVAAPKSVPGTDFVANKNSILVNDVVSFQDLTTNGPTTWSWSIGPDSLIVSGSKVPAYKYVYGSNKFQNPQVQFLLQSKYKVCLATQNAVGKGSVLCKTDYITVLPSVNIGSVKTVTDAQGYLFDDGGPNATYAANGGAPATVISPCADSVYLVFTVFDLNCGVGYLQIYEGKDATGRRLDPCGGAGLTSGFTGGTSSSACATYCMPNIYKPDTFRAKTSMFIQMNDGSTPNNAKGFAAYWWSKPKTGNPPKASFITSAPNDSACTNGTVYFTNTTTSASNDPATVVWDLDGDATTFECVGTCATAFWPYFLTGPVKITMIATNCGGSDTAVKTLMVYNPKAPKAAIKADNTSPTTNDVVFFTAPIPQCIENYKWTFTKTPVAGNGTGTVTYTGGTTKISAAPQVTFSDTGYYDVKLYVDNLSGAHKDSVTVSKYIHVRLPYCIPSVATLNQGMGISKVSFNTLANSTIQAAKDYSNFTSNLSLSTQVAAGATYPVTVQRNPNFLFEPLVRSVYIDWNQDGSFTGTGEEVAVDSNSYSASWTGKITVPKTAKLGATVMRIAVNRGTYSNKPCGQNEFGEYQDYRLYVIPYNIPPVITLKGQQGLSDTIKIEQGHTFTEPGYKAISFLYGDISSSVKRTSRKLYSTNPADSFSAFIPNIYVFSYNAADSAGNKATTQYRIVQVVKDHTPPALIVDKPDTTVIEVTSTPLSPFPAPKVLNADDLVDGPLISSVANDANKVTSNIVGLYTITYTVTDQSGNTTTVYRYVKVIDTIAPALALQGSADDTLEVNTAWHDPGVKTSDNYYSSTILNKLVKTSTNLDTSTLGSYTITYSLQDPSKNNAAYISRHVIVVDTVKPMISLLGPAADSIAVFGKYEDPGVSYSDNYNKTADISLTVTGTYYAKFTSDGKASITGSYTIIYTVTDKSGNSASISRTVLVRDWQAPVITLKGSSSVAICRWAKYEDEGYTLSDNYDAQTDIKIDTIGTFVTEGGTTIQNLLALQYRATDRAGNVSYSLPRSIWVKPADDFTCVTGIADHDGLENRIQVYPNPNTGTFHIVSSLPANMHVSISITDMMGREITRLYNGNLGPSAIEADLTSEPAGMYLLNIRTETGNIIKRIEVTR